MQMQYDPNGECYRKALLNIDRASHEIVMILRRKPNRKLAGALSKLAKAKVRVEKSKSTR